MFPGLIINDIYYCIVFFIVSAPFFTWPPSRFCSYHLSDELWHRLSCLCRIEVLLRCDRLTDILRISLCINSELPFAEASSTECSNLIRANRGPESVAALFCTQQVRTRLFTSASFSQLVPFYSNLPSYFKSARLVWPLRYWSKTFSNGPLYWKRMCWPSSSIAHSVFSLRI